MPTTPTTAGRAAAVSQLLALINADPSAALSVVVRGDRCFLTLDVPAGETLPDSIDLVFVGNSDLNDTLSEAEQDVIQALAEQPPGAVLGGARIANLVGAAHDPHFKGLLAGLRRRGFLSGEKGSQGYSLVRSTPVQPVTQKTEGQTP